MMDGPVRSEALDDPLFGNVSLEHRTAIPVLGITVHFATNSRTVLDVIEAAFGAWRALDVAPGSGEAAHVTIVVHPVEDEPEGRVMLRHRLTGGHGVAFTGAGNEAVVEPARRHARARVTPAFVRDTQHFRYTLVEAITMALITPLDRQPFHAACLVRSAAAILLTGPSGVGKSSITYAATRRLPGVTVLAEDAVYLESDERLRVWGLPGFVHLPPDITRTFTDLTDRPGVLANGKTKIAVDLRELGVAASAPFIDCASVCVLQRRGNEPALTQLDADALIDRLLSGMEEGFDLFADTIDRPLRMLARNGGWLLDLPGDAIQAMPWIDRVLREVEATRGG